MSRFWKPTAPRIIPWANGLGESRELLTYSNRTGTGGANGANVSPAADPALHWRVSTTSIVRDSPFSHYPGIRRKIVLLSGRGFRLEFDVHGNALLDEPYSSAAFLGEWPTRCTLIDGSVRVLNLMMSEGIAEPSLRHVALDAGRAIDVDAECTVIFCAGGKVTVEAQGDADQPHELVELSDGEALELLDAAGGPAPIITASTNADVLFIRIPVPYPA